MGDVCGWYSTRLFDRAVRSNFPLLRSDRYVPDTNYSKRWGVPSERERCRKRHSDVENDIPDVENDIPDVENDIPDVENDIPDVENDVSDFCDKEVLFIGTLGGTV